MAQKRKRQITPGKGSSGARTKKSQSAFIISDTSTHVNVSRRQPRKQTARKFVFNELTPRSESSYNRALNVLKLMRRGVTFTKATHASGISRLTAKKYLADVLFLDGRSFRSPKSDKLPARLKLLT